MGYLGLMGYLGYRGYLRRVYLVVLGWWGGFVLEKVVVFNLMRRIRDESEVAFAGDFAIFIEIAEGAFHRDHAIASGRFHHARNLMRLLVADKSADGDRSQQDFEGGDSAFRLVFSRQKSLGNDGFQTGRQLRADLVLTFSREDVDDAIH